MESQTRIQLLIVAVALGIILIIALVMTQSSPPAPPPVIDTSNTVRIIRATYGANCTGQKSVGERLVAAGTGTKLEVKKPVVENGNATAKVSELCANQTICKLVVSPQTLGFDPVENCNKQLQVDYRCFSYDISRSAAGNTYQTLIINCTSITDGSR